MTTTTATGRTVATSGAIRKRRNAYGRGRGRLHRLRRTVPGPQLHQQLPGTRYRAQGVDVSKDQIQQFSPSLYHYISHLQIGISGFIAATGLAVLLLALYGVRSGQVWAWVAAVAAPVLALAIALPAHYPGTSTPLATSGSSTWPR